ncbi:DUF3429 domain-containing protein [Aestuariivirga litoralis]|uniref:DUF3429 domain-containing protein n=1 Tax=Aestuariivirga litoralis TaxID=2650924 RepID=A0A2W2ATV5_9HYPH|nr:DUF3429 domain-containing protein [Aestuariivirga litoralis]PZF78695.1 DUF3429 domain-containing protein [Aestuariivirga litoralis]
MNDHSLSGRIPAPALWLGLAGLIPFLAGAASQWASLPLLPAETGLKLVIVYAAIILSFLGGIRWGTAIGPYDQGRQALEFSASVLGSLAGLAAAFLPPIPALALLIAGFLMQGLWDVMSADAGRLPAWFGRLRMILTAGAVVSLIAALLAVIVT